MVEILHLLKATSLIAGGVILLFCLISCGYLFLITLAGFCARRKHKSDFANSELTFAILIPAHDEELLIGQTVASAKQINYPTDKFKVFVVADNCTDSTSARASGAGAIVFDRTDRENRGKGHALVAGLKFIFESMSSVDAVAIVDADTQIDPGFLSAMAESILAGECAIQGVYLGSNQHDSWRTELLQLAWSLFNYLRPLGRTTLGFSASLLGNGMCFRADLLKSRSWSAFSITEDIEYGIQLLLSGKRVGFNQYARVFGQMAKTADQAKSQRLRWEKGRLAILKQFAGPLSKRSLFHFDFAAAEMLIDMITPPLAVIVSLSLAATILMAVASIKLAIFCAIPIALLFVCILMGFVTVGPSWKLLRSLFYAPIYIVWKLVLYAAQMIRPNRRIEWVRTSRHN